MSFANPLMLLGLLAASVPIIIHLINRFRPREQSFPAMELLLKSIERVERRWRIRRLALLALRVILLSALAFAAAGPILGSGPVSEDTRSLGSERIALVIDASLSMRAKYRERSAFSRALDAARRRIERLRSTDDAIIVVSGTPPRIPIATPTSDRGRLHGVLSELEAGWRPVSLSEAVSSGVEALSRAPRVELEQSGEGTATQPRVVLFSDLAHNNFDGAATLEMPGTGQSVVLEVVDVLAHIPPQERKNRGFVNAVSEIVPSTTPRTVEILARVQSYDHLSDKREQTAAAEDLNLVLREGTQVLLETPVELVPSTLTQKTVQHSFGASGTRLCVLEVRGDRLEADDRYYLRIDVRKQVRTLIIDGDPSGIAKEDEVFYLERAIKAGSPDQPTPKIITPDDLARSDLEQYDVIVMAGVASISRAEGQRIVRFVEEGGGLWITTAEGLDISSYTNALSRILPGKLDSLRFLENDETLTFIRPDLDHSILRLFAGEALSGLLTTESRAYARLQPEKKARVTTILRFEDQEPALVVSRIGEGRVAFLTTSIDRDLSDLPIRPSFVPLVRQMLLWLGDAIAEPDLRRTYVGDVRDILVAPGVTQLQVSTPSGSTHRFGLAELNDGIVRFSSTDEPGFYTVRASFGKELLPVPSSSFAVNIDPAESDLRPINVEEAKAVLRGEASVENQAAGSVARRQTSGVFSREQLSRALLVIMGFAFLLESALTAMRTGR